MGIEDKLDQTKGRAEEAAGDLTGNEDLQARGEEHQAEGKVKGAIDSGQEKLKDAVDKVTDKADDDKS